MSRESVNSRQLVLRALQGRETERPAMGPLAVHFCAAAAGVSLKAYTTDPDVLADCVIRYYDRFRPDAVWLSADTWVTAEAMGARVAFTREDQPLGGLGDPLIRTPSDIDRIPPPDPESQGRWPAMLRALQKIRSALAGDVFIVACFDQYPFSLACALMGIEEVMLRLHDDRALVDALMERCRQYAIAYAEALARVGADMLSGGDSPAGLLGPRLYRDVALPYEKLVIGELQRLDLPVSLHICGNSTRILADMARSGADVLELDHQVDMAEACRLIGPGIAVWGNLDPVGLLARSAPDRVRRATLALLDSFRACEHRRFVLSSGCTLSVDTPAENLHAMIAAARCAGE